MFDSPLRYPGGKGRLSQYVIDLIEMNDLTGGHYVEPYAGGAGIAITLLYLEYVGHVHLNDLNKSVHAFWRSLLDEPDGLCRLIRDTPITVEEWERQKAVNRTNRSGIITGGIIGGKNQNGPWKLDARFNRQELSKRVAKIASYAPRISLHNLDASEFISDLLTKIPPSALVYIDPPYYEKGRKLYENRYQHDDHEAIAKLVTEIRQKWIVSYDNAEPIRRFYSNFRQHTFGLRYSAQDAYEGTEVMVFCDGLKTPGEVQPWRGIAA